MHIRRAVKPMYFWQNICIECVQNIYTTSKRLLTKDGPISGEKTAACYFKNFKGYESGSFKTPGQLRG